MNKLTMSICVLFLGLQVAGQKSPRSIDNQRYERRPNNIYGEIQSEYVGQEFRADKAAQEDEVALVKMLKETGPIDFEKWDSIGERVISRANVTEETKRVVRQTINDTRSTIQQVGDVLAENIVSDTTTKAPKKSQQGKNTSVTTASADVTISTANQTSTTQAPYKLTRSTLENIVRRNVRGLVRLFNIEWKDAITQSRINIKTFRKELSKSAQPFLADNPDAY
ncbi:hypothetical protein G9C98_005269 [Cotesia typhae]|uniref:Uncharacterized protein n=1 Tax=Cotesia typhae TaxID=2053667 RepID=A0A8J5QU72_9HYME|nr:hypothetical protein G9C98_005269 [Cotesia typhae]